VPDVGPVLCVDVKTGKGRERSRCTYALPPWFAPPFCMCTCRESWETLHNGPEGRQSSTRFSVACVTRMCTICKSRFTRDSGVSENMTFPSERSMRVKLIAERDQVWSMFKPRALNQATISSSVSA
jgi:hypothetical protein